MEFYLIYRGKLPAQGSGGGKPKDKQILRKEFHKQLKELWNQHPDLSEQANNRFLIIKRSDGTEDVHPARNAPKGHPQVKTWVEKIAEDHQRCNCKWVPLISNKGGFTCSLDILFLRRDNPGHLIASGGDIDNRIKVLLDGLRMPENETELGGIPIEEDENPFFCLLEDDTLITSMSVKTDRLILPQDPEENIHDVLLLIHVSVVNPSAIFAGDRLV